MITVEINDYIKLSTLSTNLMGFDKHIDPEDSRDDQLLSMDEVFLRRLRKAIEDNLEVQEFGVDELGREIGMSRSQIHRKLQALTGKSASRYMRSYKLEKARDLLRRNVGNISEISFKLGFSSPAYFGQVYVEEFGYPPSDERKNSSPVNVSTSQSSEVTSKEVRKLAAIMFTDIVGYTALMGGNEQKGLELLRQNRSLQRPLIEKHNGKWLKEIGDGVLAQFDSAYDAVLCALKIQRAAATGFEGKLRIGLHLGDVTMENDDIFGEGVNIASRIEGIADPGGVYLTQSIQRAIRGRSEFEVLKLGEVQLKNVDYLVNVWCLQGEGLPVPSAAKVQQLRAARMRESGVPLSNVNDSLIQKVFDELAKTKPSISRFLFIEEEDDDEPDIRELADLIIRNYPWMVGVELRRLFSGSLRVLNRNRLLQIFATLYRTLQFLSFVLLIELYELVSEDKLRLDKKFVSELKARFLELKFEDFVWITKQIGEILGGTETTRFIPEAIKNLDEKFYAALDFELPQKNVHGDYQLASSSEEIEHDCIEYQEKLTFILKRVAFLTKYKLVTIKEIKVLKSRHREALFQHWIDILYSSDSDFRSKEEIFDSFSDSNAVLLMKSLKKPGDFLNLSPFIIDTRGEIIDSKEKFNLKKDIFICEGFSNNHIRYTGTEVTEETNLQSLSNYHELVEDFRQILDMTNNTNHNNKK
jgi:class 3 adenylate cyclase